MTKQSLSTSPSPSGQPIQQRKLLGYGFVKGLLLLGLLLSLTGCEDYSRPGTRTDDLPFGWRIEEGRSQMLSRSYPSFDWIALILKIKGESRRLFSARYPTPPRPQKNLWFMQRQRSKPYGMQQQKKPPKKPKAIGFRFYYRSKYAAKLEIRLPYRTQYGFTKGYRHNWTVEPSKRKWKQVAFLYKDFRPVDSAMDAQRLDPYTVSHIEVWEQAKGNKSGSVTMMLQGPFLYRPKKTKACKQPPKAKKTKPSNKTKAAPTSRPTSRPVLKPTPSSRPVQRKQPPTSKPTSKPSRQR